MKSRFAVSLLFILIAANILASNGAATFEKLKALPRSWAGTCPGSRVVQVLNRIVSDAAALISQVRGDENKQTVIHLDDDRLMFTQHRSAGNQPRMIGTVSPDGKTITFSTFDATGLLTSPEEHMQHIVFNLIDSDHHSESVDFAIGDIKRLMQESLDLRRGK